MDGIDWWTPALLVLLICFSAFFSASETAYSAGNKIRLKNLADDGNRRAKAAYPIAERFDRTLSVILVGNNIVNIAAASTATLIASGLFGATGAAVSTVVMTVVILVFGEILPKSFAKENSETVAMAVAAPFSLISTVMYPVAFFFIKLQEILGRFYGNKNPQPLVTEDELMTIIEAIEEEGVIDEQKSELVQSALTFDDTTVQEVLTPRVDLVAIDLGDDPEEIRQAILSERFSRLPVYEKSLDNIIGILQTRDYLEAALTSRGPVDLRPMLAKPLFVHKTKKISALLAEFKRERIHMAVVIDDYGGTMGIVSMEDLLEELVGEIWDEDEEAEFDFVTVEPYVYSISGDYGIHEALEKIGYSERDFDSDYSSIGGWALERLGRIPAVGDSFDYNGVHVEVEAMDEKRITRLTVRYTPPAPTE